MGYASAIGWLLFTIVLILTVALFAFARRRVYYRGRGSMSARTNPRLLSFSDRGPVVRSLRRYLGRATITLFAVMLLSAFLLPLSPSW